MKIGIASDHRGYELKNNLIKELTNYQIIDCGNTEYDPLDDAPKYALKLGRMVANKELDYGIVICGTGIAVSIACNKVKGIRCAKIDNIDEARLSKQHNNANIIAFSANKSLEEALKMINTFIENEFLTDEKYQRRNDIIIKYENGEYNEL